jgi:hypothetical protein
VAESSDEGRNGPPPPPLRHTVESDVRTWHERFEALNGLMKQLQEKEEDDEGTGE